ncbi:MAG TPA: MlaD family protein [Candidatus Dormibacteraeota bacterium]|jgi:phospholipid/cholesterol/gamma-HCH transport system substrate-binding protein|nr:MlaD family protein [Candidatus Dormibacteraeota bacterium]
MAPPPLRRAAVSLGLACLFVLVVVAGTAFQRGLLGPGDYLVRVPTDNAQGIYAGSEVLIAGVEAGSVQGVTLGSGGLAVITAEIDPAYAPIHTDATASIRPKSLLGEMYVGIDPGTSGPTLPSGAALPHLQVNRSTDLQDVINTFNAPTRQKLQTVIDELGGGLDGEGANASVAIGNGNKDLSDLAAIAHTLAQKDQDLQLVIQDLNSVLSELAQSDRRQQLGELIQNTQQLLANLDQQQRQIQAAITNTNAALEQLSGGLAGTEPSLSGVAAELPGTAKEGNLVLGDLASDSSELLPNLPSVIQGIQYGPVVFGGRDATGYATRISLVLGCDSISLCPELTGPLSQVPLQKEATGTPTPAPSGGGGQQPAAPAPGSTSGSGTGTGAVSQLLGNGILGFLLGNTP